MIRIFPQPLFVSLTQRDSCGQLLLNMSKQDCIEERKRKLCKPIFSCIYNLISRVVFSSLLALFLVWCFFGIFSCNSYFLLTISSGEIAVHYCGSPVFLYNQIKFSFLASSKTLLCILRQIAIVICNK